MKLKHAVQKICSITALTALFMPFSFLHGEPVESKYKGFTIDESRVRNMADLGKILKATKEQIDIVYEVGVPTEILEFFRSVPFILVPSGEISSGSPGLYGGKDRSVKVTSKIVTTGHKPVLLHELLHAYHDQKIPQGFNNEDIIQYFKRAQTIGAYDFKSHMMKNEREFFACSATSYLFGVTAQEPFKRDKVKDSQPKFFAHLKALFGQGAGNYVGTLTDK